MNITGNENGYFNVVELFNSTPTNINTFNSSLCAVQRASSTGGSLLTYRPSDGIPAFSQFTPNSGYIVLAKENFVLSEDQAQPSLNARVCEGNNIGKFTILKYNYDQAQNINTFNPSLCAVQRASNTGGSLLTYRPSDGIPAFSQFTPNSGYIVLAKENFSIPKNNFVLNHFLYPAYNTTAYASAKSSGLGSLQSFSYLNNKWVILRSDGCAGRNQYVDYSEDSYSFTSAVVTVNPPGDGGTCSPSLSPGNFPVLNIINYGGGKYIIFPYNNAKTSYNNPSNPAKWISNLGFYSTDLINWNTFTLPISCYIEQFMYADGLWVAAINSASDGFTSAPVSSFLFSQDGINWNTRNLIDKNGNIFLANINKVSYCNGVWCLHNNQSYCLSATKSDIINNVFNIPFDIYNDGDLTKRWNWLLTPTLTTAYAVPSYRGLPTYNSDSEPFCLLPIQNQIIIKSGSPARFDNVNYAVKTTNFKDYTLVTLPVAARWAATKFIPFLQKWLITSSTQLLNTTNTLNPALSGSVGIGSYALLSKDASATSWDVLNVRDGQWIFTCVDNISGKIISMGWFSDIIPFNSPQTVQILRNDFLTLNYTTDFIPLSVTQSGGAYNISQFGTNNPSITCFRGTNYDFILNNISSHPFALRASNGDTTTQISGTFNNNPLNGKTSGRIMFTPDSSTPNTIVYQCTVHSNMIGTINIRDY